MAQNSNQGDVEQGAVQNGQGQQNGLRRGRGFAGMDEARQREIASKGGRAAHAKGTAHEFTPEEARKAGRKGGEVVSQNREHMATIGREGGQARGNRHRMAAQSRAGQIGGEESLRLDDDNILHGAIGEGGEYSSPVDQSSLSEDRGRMGRDFGESDESSGQSSL